LKGMPMEYGMSNGSLESIFIESKLKRR